MHGMAGSSFLSWLPLFNSPKYGNRTFSLTFLAVTHQYLFSWVASLAGLAGRAVWVHPWHHCGSTEKRSDLLWKKQSAPPKVVAIFVAQIHWRMQHV